MGDAARDLASLTWGGGAWPEVDRDEAWVPVYRPRLPVAEQLLPYLQRIDARRIYSNHGPLATEFVHRLTILLGLSRGSVAAAASGHAALVAAILSHAGVGRAERPLALIPGFTFCSTALAAEQCGYTPYFVDVEAGTWQLAPETLRQHPQLGRVGLVVPVAPYGTAIDVDCWEEFQRSTGIPVVIDAAAAFAAFADGRSHAGTVPSVLSFHATKCFSTGEGGGVLCTDPGLVEKIVRTLSFGFLGDRDCKAMSFNGKLSEYHAAVGLAQLDDWSPLRESWSRVAGMYAAAAGKAGIGAELLRAPEVGANHVFFRTRSIEAGRAVAESLDSAGIDTRFWYGEGMHRHTHFSDAPRDPLPMTEELCGCLIGLPMAVDLGPEAIGKVIDALGVAEAYPSRE
jgi:dTDP-4-amino-4,6-dideoxygalactose transaminase